MPDTSLRSLPLVDLGPITTAFQGPSAYTGKPHEGVDIAVASGTEIKEPIGGVFVGVIHDSLGGLQAIVQTATGYREIYAHLSSVPAIRSGATVKAGDVIATSGASGLVTGPHLHYEVRSPQGQAVDPIAFLGEFVPHESGPQPIDEARRQRIKDFLDRLVAEVFQPFGAIDEAEAARRLRAAFPDIPISELRDIAFGRASDVQRAIPDARQVPVLGGIGEALSDKAQGKPSALDRIADTIGDLSKPQTWAKLGFTLAAVAVIGVGVLLYMGGLRVSGPQPISVGP